MVSQLGILDLGDCSFSMSLVVLPPHTVLTPILLSAAAGG